MASLFSSPKPPKPPPKDDKAEQQALAEARARRNAAAGSGYRGTMISDAYKTLNTTLG